MFWEMKIQEEEMDRAYYEVVTKELEFRDKKQEYNKTMKQRGIQDEKQEWAYDKMTK